MTSTIHVVAALIDRADGRALMVRKRGTTAFMQPGGKPEPGEELLAALRRELVEELGLDLADDRFEPLGEFGADAANEPGHAVRATVWSVALTGEEPRTAAEIDALAWVVPLQPDVELAPLSEHELLPLLVQKRLSEKPRSD